MWAIPAEETAHKAILYTHGGAYVSGSPSTHEPLICRLAEQCRLPVFAYDYRLAPENLFPAALEDAVTAFDFLLDQGYNPGDIVLCGDSAGGGLTLSLTMALRDRGRALPAALVVISPWTDLTESLDTHYSNTGSDPLISSEELREMGPAVRGGTGFENPVYIAVVRRFHRLSAGAHPRGERRGAAGRFPGAGHPDGGPGGNGGHRHLRRHVACLAHVRRGGSRAAIRKIQWFVHAQLEVGGLKKRVIRPGAKYRHFKGKEYRVLYVARHSETLEEMVVYQQLYGEMGVWVRPLEMFLGTVDRDGTTRYRFEEIED